MAGERRDGSVPEMAFVFVRQDDPPPTEWMARHPGWVKFPATLVTGSAQDGRRGGARQSGSDAGSPRGGAASPVMTGGLTAQRPERDSLAHLPRPVGRFGRGDGQDGRDDPITVYLRVSGALAGMGLVEPVAAWRSEAGHGAGPAGTLAPATVPVAMSRPPDVGSGLHASTEGLVDDLAPAGSYEVAQPEGPPEEAERLGPTGEPLSLQEEANTNMYYNAFRALRDIDPTNPAVTREVVVPQNWVPSDADVQDIRQALADARQSAVKPEILSQDQRGSYSQSDYDTLAIDPARGKVIDEKAIQERQVGLNAERQGLLPGPITRDPTGAAEFIDGAGQTWDVKGFNSNPLYTRGRFNVRRDADNVDKSLAKKENVIIDTTKMNQKDIDALQSEGVLRGWGNRVIWP